MEKRYRALRFISVFYKIIGWIMLVVAVLGSVAACLMGVLGGSLFNEYSSQIGLQFEGVIAGLITGFALLVFGLVSSLALIAIGEAIHLAIDIEENTRAAARFLADQLRLQTPPAPLQPAQMVQPPVVR